MNETPEIPTETVRRVNGFAPGDRVAIVNCELTGAYGKVVQSGGGCMAGCRESCRLVHVDLMNKLDDDDDGRRGSYLRGNVKRFLAAEVTHID